MQEGIMLEEGYVEVAVPKMQEKGSSDNYIIETVYPYVFNGRSRLSGLYGML